MEKHDLSQLEARIKSIGDDLTHLADGKDFQEFLRIIHKPGWTTPAESLLVMGMVEAMYSHTKTLASLKQALLEGSRRVAG